MKAFVDNQQIFGDTLYIGYSDGTFKLMDATAVGCDWFRMSNDAFFDTYGFNLDIHRLGDLYERCKKIAYG